MKNVTIQNLLSEKLNLLLKDISFNSSEILLDKRESEHLHKFRVAIRKIRVYLNHLSKYFNNEPLLKFQKDFRYLAKLTNEPRDLDVYLEKSDSYINLLPKDEQKNLTSLIKYLKNKRDKEYKNLVKALNSKRYKDIIKNFNQLINSNNIFTKKDKKALKVANKNLSKLYKNIVKNGTKLNKKSLNSKFHKLRIKYKKLRYLIELFLPFYKNCSNVNVIDRLKVIQTLLGDINDYEVHGNKLTFFIKEIKSEKERLKTINNLIEKFKEEQDIIKSQFHYIFKSFNHNKFKKELVKLR